MQFIKTLTEKQKEMCENIIGIYVYGTWETIVKNRRITIIGIYLPPIGIMAGNLHTKFLDEVSQLVQYFITNHQNLVLLENFNIDTQDLINLDSLEYNDTMEDLGLRQHIIEPTHKQGNTLDLIYTESINIHWKVLHAFIGNFILDHRLVGVELQLRKQYEKISQLDTETSRHSI